MNGISRQYENLANAIVELAVKDYISVLKILKHYPDNYDAKTTKKSLERFFKSDWYKALTNVDGEWLIKKLQSGVK